MQSIKNVQFISLVVDIRTGRGTVCNGSSCRELVVCIGNCFARTAQSIGLCMFGTARISNTWVDTARARISITPQSVTAANKNESTFFIAFIKYPPQKIKTV